MVTYPIKLAKKNNLGSKGDRRGLRVALLVVEKEAAVVFYQIFILILIFFSFFIS